jgi:hypothetical protein
MNVSDLKLNFLSDYFIQLIRRLSPPITEEIELKHNGKLGISITGGIGNEYHQK